jgi:hypothetical protein
MPSKTSKTKQGTDEALNLVLKDFKAAWDYTSGSWHKRWEDNYKLYNNQRVSVGYVGISNVFVPMTSSTVDALTSGLYGAKPKIEFVPPMDKADQQTDQLNAKLDEYWERDQWSLKIPETGKFKFMLGTAVDYFCWDIDHPVLIHVPIRDFFIDPMASTLENARFMGRRYLTTKDELESFEIVDPATGEMVKKYKNLDRVNDYKNPDYTDKEQKDMWYGSTITKPEDDQVECLEYWREDRVITVANRCAVIEDTENYYKAKGKANGNQYAKGIMPFADDRDIVDPSLFYAKSTVDTIAGQQEQLNDLTNQLADALTYVINQQYTIDPKFAHLQGQVRNLPGGTFVAAKDAISPIQRGTIPPDAFLQVQNIKNEIRETTGVNEVVKGAPAEGGKATATEINAQVAGAGQRIGLKVTQLENGYFHRMARIIFAMIRLYVTDVTPVRVNGKDGEVVEDYDPAEFADGDYEPRIQLDIVIENKKKEAAMNAKEMMAAFLNDPDVNQVWLKKKVLGTGFDLDPDEIEEAFVPNPMQAPQPGMPGMEGDPMAGAPADPMMGGGMDIASQIPPEILEQLPPDVTEEEIQMLLEGLQSEQGAMV